MSEYTNYQDVLSFYQRKRKETPRGVSLKLERGKHLLLQFIFPDTGKRSSKACNCAFTEVGIIKAVEASWKVREALDTLVTASAFWNWYDHEILKLNQIENDLLTYQQIFEEIEQEYFKGRNKNTKRKRSRELESDVASFEGCYKRFFKAIEQPNEYPNWNSLKQALYSFEQGTKSFKDAYFVLKKVASKSGNSKELLERLSDIDYRQTEFKEKQSISLDDYLTWFDRISQDETISHSWLWVSAMCLIYGLRPSEIAAAKNLMQSVTIDGIKFLPICNPDNKDLLLVLDDFTYFGASIKTGGRICKPMASDSSLISRLKIREVNLPRLESKKAKAFSARFTQWLTRNNCPVTQAYAFRHLANQLGEQYGIPQEIRARMLGHSVAVNDSTYKKRSNTQTTVNLLTQHSKQPLSLELAKDALSRNNFDLEDSSVKAILRIIYQTDL